MFESRNIIFTKDQQRKLQFIATAMLTKTEAQIIDTIISDTYKQIKFGSTKKHEVSLTTNDNCIIIDDHAYLFADNVELIEYLPDFNAVSIRIDNKYVGENGYYDESDMQDIVLKDLYEGINENGRCVCTEVIDNKVVYLTNEEVEYLDLVQHPKTGRYIF